MLYELSKKRIFVAGHTGMVGGAVTRRLQQESCDVVLVGRQDLDLADTQAVSSWMQINRPDVIVLAAAQKRQTIDAVIRLCAIRAASLQKNGAGD